MYCTWTIPDFPKVGLKCVRACVHARGAVIRPDQTRLGKADAATAPPEDDESSGGKKRAEKGKDRKKKVNFTSCLFFSRPLFPS